MKIFAKHKPLVLALLCVSVLLGWGCSGARQFARPVPPPDDRRPVPMPEPREINLATDNVNKIAILPTQRLFDLSQHFRAIFNKRKPAANIDAFDEVYNSSWFTNRNGARPLSLAEIARGPDRGSGPDTAGVWTVVRAKTEGVTPGFTIRDARGDWYVIKFDPPGYPELATGAELVSTKLFHAAGYNVPENYLVQFDPQKLQLGQAVSFTDRPGKKRFMTETDLAEILNRIQKQPDGRVRAVASKFLPGEPLGAFDYIGLRKNDLNDVIPHQHRRELRGLKVIAAWLNHFDTKSNNSLDMYDPAGFVKHYLIDFGSTLGSQGDEPMPPEIGREGIADPPQVLKLLGSLGAYTRPWERPVSIPFPSVGYFVSHDFQPGAYKFILPNPAFANATPRDGYWGAKIVMSFSDAQIRAAVARGQYSDPAAAEYLTRIIIERQDITGRYWFNRMPPLDHFELCRTAAGEAALCFADLAVKYGLAAPEEVRYQYEIHRGKKRLTAPPVLTGNDSAMIPLPAVRPAAGARPEEQWTITLRRQQQGEKWSQSVRVYLGWKESTGEFELLGIRREE